MILDRARKRFIYTQAGKGWLKKKNQDPRMAILRSLKLPRTGKIAQHPFFSHKTQGSHAAITRWYDAEWVSKMFPSTPEI